MIETFSSLPKRALRLHWGVILIVTFLSVFGFVLLYDAAGGYEPYTVRQISRFGVGFVVMILLAIVSIRLHKNYAAGVYGFALILLLLVPFVGVTGMGAQRWINLKFMVVQPSELMKIGLIMMLARFYHTRSMVAIHTLKNLSMPLLFIGLPVGLVLLQPDLGTAISLALIGAVMLFAAGVNAKLFIGGGMLGIAALPVAWHFLLHDYQKKRLLVFLNPEDDPLGSGYHIMQSKIAIGSSGFWGKGFGEGTQSHLMFLPEKHTDFIFTLLTEDFGMFGALLLMSCYGLLVLSGVLISLRAQSVYGRLVAVGTTFMVFIHALINMSMVMGLMPVVGIPLPFVSYGGTSLMTMMMAMGMLLNAHVHRDVELPGASGLSPERAFLPTRRIW